MDARFSGRENAAYIAHQLSRLGDVNESYSYWTFGDILENDNGDGGYCGVAWNHRPQDGEVLALAIALPAQADERQRL